MASINNNPLSSMSKEIKEKLYAALMDRSPEPSTEGNLNLRKILVESGDTEIIMENMKLDLTNRQSIESIRREKGKVRAMIKLLDVVVNNEMIDNFHSALIHASQGNLAEKIVKKCSEIKDQCGRTF